MKLDNQRIVQIYDFTGNIVGKMTIETIKKIYSGSMALDRYIQINNVKMSIQHAKFMQYI